MEPMGQPVEPPHSGRCPERRATARYAWDREVALRALPNGAGDVVHWACAQNLSGGGIGLLLSCPFEQGTILTIELGSRKGNARRVVAGRVVHNRREMHGNSFLGCAFLETLPADRLQDLLD